MIQVNKLQYTGGKKENEKQDDKSNGDGNDGMYAAYGVWSKQRGWGYAMWGGRN